MRVCGTGWACGACYFAWHRCEKQINLMVLEMIYKVEGCLGSKIIQCEQLHYQVKFHFSRSSAPYWYNEWAALWHLIDLYWRCCLLDIRISFLWQKGWWILTWHIQAICIVRVQCLLFGFWSLENIMYGLVGIVHIHEVAKSVAEHLAAVVLTGMLFKFLQLLQNIFCIIFFLKVHKTPFFLCLPDTTPYSFSSIAGTLSSISSWWIVSWCFLHPLQMSMNPSITSQQYIKLNQCGHLKFFVLLNENEASSKTIWHTWLLNNIKTLQTIS